MQKAQISLDLLLTLIIAIIIISSFNGLTENFRIDKEKMLVEQQLNDITLKTASVITSTQSLADTNFYIELAINKIQYVDEKGNTHNIYPDIVYMPDDKKLALSTVISTKYGSIDINSFAYISKTSNTDINTIPIRTKGFMVIKNV
ncbi:MAG: hypothetical protein WC462_01075 [archaeon]